MKRHPLLLCLPIAPIAILVAGEIVCRFVLGLGSPPLFVEHPTIEYLSKPNQDVIRFGNRFQTNAWGMRSPAFPARKLEQKELRILVFGDSVVNGGALTDQSSLATELLKKSLAERHNGPVVVGNVSAGSWGPGNWRAFAAEYGFFDADHVILVLGIADMGDCPKFEALNSDHPTESPSLAISELFSRYLPRYLGKTPRPVGGYPDRDEEPSPAEVVGLDDLRQFLAMAKASVSNVSVVYYLDRNEVESRAKSPRFRHLAKICEESGAPVHSTLERFSSAPNLFRDGIHPNDAGQVQLKNAILDGVFHREPRDKKS